MSSKNNLLISSTGLILAPCSYCHRKPGYFLKSKNFCWFHWYKFKDNKLIDFSERNQLNHFDSINKIQNEKDFIPNQ